MANNELSDSSLAITLSNYLSKKEDILTEFYFTETIGTIAYINKNFDILKKFASWLYFNMRG